MQHPRVRAHYEHPMSRWHIAAELDDPWHPGGYFIYRLPEFFTFANSVYLAQPYGDSCWRGVQPEAEPEWSFDPNEKQTEYHIRFYDSLELRVEIKTGRDVVDFAYIITNKTERPGVPSTESCLMLWTSPHFIDRRHDRTFVWIEGEPTPVRKLTPTPEDTKKLSWVTIGVGKAARQPLHYKSSMWGVNEAADHGLIAVRSSVDNCWLGLGWADANKLMARSAIPCLHSEPSYPEIRPGQQIRATGRIYFHEGDLKTLEKRFHGDVEDEISAVKAVG